MFINERYVNSHFRSLLISRFNYSKVSHIVKLRSCKILALIPPSHYEVMASVLFLGTGIWPYSRIFEKKKKKKRGKFYLLLLVVHISKYWQYFGNAFFWKISQLYFPCIDAADPQADYVFVIRGICKNATIYNAPYLIEGFVELGFLMGYSARAIKSLAVMWDVKWVFTTNNVQTVAEHTAPIRVYSFAATNKIPFVSVFKN